MSIIALQVFMICSKWVTIKECKGAEMDEKHSKEVRTAPQIPDYVPEVEYKDFKERSKDGYILKGVQSHAASYMKKRLGACFSTLEGKLRLTQPYKKWQAYAHIDSDELGRNMDANWDRIIEIDPRLASSSTYLNSAQAGSGPVGPNLHLTQKVGEYQDPMTDPLFKEIVLRLRSEFVTGMSARADSDDDMLVKGSYSSSVGWSPEIGESCGRDTTTKYAIIEHCSKDTLFDEMAKFHPIIAGNRVQFDKPGKIRKGFVHTDKRGDELIYADTVHPFGRLAARVRTVAAIPWLSNIPLIIANQWVENGKTPFLKLVLEQRHDVVKGIIMNKHVCCSDVPNNDQHMWPSVIDATFDALLAPKLAERAKQMMRLSPILGAYTDMRDGAFGGYDTYFYEIERHENDVFYQNFSGHGLTKYPNVFQNLGIQLWCHMKTGYWRNLDELFSAILKGTVVCLNNGDDCVDGHDDPKYVEKFIEISNTNPFAPRGLEPPSYSGKDFRTDGTGKVTDLVFPVPSIILNTLSNERRDYTSKLRSSPMIGIKARLETAHELSGGDHETVDYVSEVLFDILGLPFANLDKMAADEQKAIEAEGGRDYFIDRLTMKLIEAGYPVSNSNDLAWRYEHSLLREIDPEAFDEIFIQYPIDFTSNPHHFVNI